MMWTSIKRIIKSGFKSFWRNGFVSLASLLVLVITLFTVGTGMLVGAMLGTALEEIKSKVDVNVYFVPEAEEERVLVLKAAIEELPEVATVEYVSREQALENFRVRHENDQLTLQALDELSENPLGAILNIRAQETSQYEAIARFLEGEEERIDTVIDRTNFFDNKVAIDRLTKIIDSAERLGMALTVILAIISIVITFNTIRLATYVAREEIGVMRLVGASNMYIRGPFVVSGVLYGVLAAFVTLAILYPLTYWVGPTTEKFFGSINMFTYYVENFNRLFLVLVVTGVVLGGISSWLAVRRYLKI